MQNPFSEKRRAWLWPFIMAGAIFVASSQSKLAGPSLPGIDKITHFLVYGLLATLVVRLGRRPVSAWVSLVVVSAYGWSDEWHQSFTPGRAVELADWMADTLGAALAIVLYRRWKRYRMLLERPVKPHRRIEKPATVATVSSS